MRPAAARRDPKILEASRKTSTYAASTEILVICATKKKGFFISSRSQQEKNAFLPRKRCYWSGTVEGAEFFSLACRSPTVLLSLGLPVEALLLLPGARQCPECAEPAFRAYYQMEHSNNQILSTTVLKNLNNINRFFSSITTSYFYPLRKANRKSSRKIKSI